MTREYYQVVEHNNNEGETWCFYVPLTVDEVNHILEVVDEAGLEDSYSINEPVTEEVVDILVAHGNQATGYHDPHTKCRGHSFDNLIEELNAENAEDYLYKGGCWRMK